MAILDNFEVVVLTSSRPNTDSLNASKSIWASVKEYEPPGSVHYIPSFNTCCKYIGVPHTLARGRRNQCGNEFAIDYKVKCGFSFPDQHETEAEYIVFRTYLDGERIGSAYIKQARWERSGTYRVRKQGKRYMLEDGQRWIRQRWSFDPGLHGTIKVKVWRERSEVPVMTDWGVIDLTRGEDPTMRSEELSAISFDSDVRRPRVRHLNKLDLLPIATFEFEYRSDDTLRLLGHEIEISKPQEAADEIFTEENNELWDSIINTHSSEGTVDTMMGTLLYEINEQSDSIGTLHCNEWRQNSTRGMLVCADNVEQSDSRCVEMTELQAVHKLDGVNPQPAENGHFGFIAHSGDTWGTDADKSVGSRRLQALGNIDIVDLTMLD